MCLLIGARSLALGEPNDQDTAATPRPDGANQWAAEPGDFDHRAWSIEEGLPQNTITSMVQTRDGYLWLGTFGGLARFDGVRFT
ncbi:MAG: hypothetical protein GY778_28255, partial [bacterium]|nr:hypothetical protein [bacterium]